MSRTTIHGSMVADGSLSLSKIAGAAKAGNDPKILTGTPGANNELAKFDADGSTVGSGITVAAFNNKSNVGHTHTAFEITGLVTGVSGVNVQVKTATGTYTPTAGMKYVRVRMQAPGGGSGGADNHNVGGGGGAGEYAEGLYTAAQIGAGQTVSFGAPGTAGAATGTNGGDAGNVVLGNLISAFGGKGGKGAAAAAVGTPIIGGGDGGTGGGGGYLRVKGEAGHPGTRSSFTWTESDNDGGSLRFFSNVLVPGRGGRSMFGAGPATTFPTTDAPGVTGQDYGSGATGAIEDDATGQPGAPGAPGIMVFEEYF